MFTKPLIFVVISFLGVALIYSSSSTFDVFGEIKKSEIDCIPESGNNIVHCCYKEYDSESGDTVAIYCATCYDNGGSLACDAYDKVASIKPDDIPPTPPTGGKGIFGSNILPSPSTSPGEEVPNDGEVVEQPPTTPTVPPTGPTVVPENDQDTNDGGEKPPRGNDVVPDKGITEPPQGADQGLIPLDDPGLVLSPIGEETTVPQSGQGEKVPLSPGGVAPLPNQGTLPPTDEARQPRFYSPTGGCATYNTAQCIPCDPGLAGASCTPETEWPTNTDTSKGTPTPTTPPLFGNDASVLQDGGQDGQVIAKDDDDDGPVPPECPKTGPIPPDCTMKPKFPTENALE